MKIKHLIPRKNGPGEVHLPLAYEDPFYALERGVNDLFRSVISGGFSDEPLHSWEKSVAAFSPRLEVAEGDKDVTVSAELPGMDEKDIEVLLEGNMLTIKGEKKEEHEEKKKGYYRSERTYGSFLRQIELPEGIDAANIKAEFKKGVLNVALPKRPEAQVQPKKIDVKSE